MFIAISCDDSKYLAPDGYSRRGKSVTSHGNSPKVEKDLIIRDQADDEVLPSYNIPANWIRYAGRLIFPSAASDSTCFM